jgi:hypothetical protein
MTDIHWFIAFAIWMSAGIAVFGFFEARGRVDGPVHTLSRAVWDLFQAFPLAVLIFVFNLGGLIYGLMVHFFWHWSPPGSVSQGALWQAIQ